MLSKGQLKFTTLTVVKEETVSLLLYKYIVCIEFLTKPKKIEQTTKNKSCLYFDILKFLFSKHCNISAVNIKYKSGPARNACSFHFQVFLVFLGTTVVVAQVVSAQGWMRMWGT